MVCIIKDSKEWIEFEKEVGPNLADYIAVRNGNMYPTDEQMTAQKALVKRKKNNVSGAVIDKYEMEVLMSNRRNNTSHWFVAERMGQSDTYKIHFKTNYLPIKVAKQRQADPTSTLDPNEQFDAMSRGHRPLKGYKLDYQIAAIRNKMDETNQLDLFANPGINQESFLEISSQDEMTSADKEQRFDTSNEFGIEFINKLSDKLGIDYEVISEDEAKELTKSNLQPWNGEKGFFLNNKVYLVNNIDGDTAFHEFSHPLFRSISQNNPELFNNMFYKMSQHKDGKGIIENVREAYPDLDPSTDLFKEECLVMGMSYYKDKEKNGLVQDLLYHIKRFLRAIFGNTINISKLDVNTSVWEMYNLLHNENFKIDLEYITPSDVASYLRDFRADELKGIDRDVIQEKLTLAYDNARNLVRKLQNDKNYRALNQVLTNKYNDNELEKVLKNLSEFKNAFDNQLNSELSDMEQASNEMLAFVDTIGSLYNLTDKIYKNITELSKKEEDVEQILKYQAYRNFIRTWSGYLDTVKEAMIDVPVHAEILSTINNTSNLIDKIDAVIENKNKSMAETVLYDQLSHIADKLEDRYTKRIAHLESNGASKSLIDRTYKEYYGLTKDEINRVSILSSKGRLTPSEQNELAVLKAQTSKGLQITKEKIRDTLSGKLGDASFMSSQFESYLNNPDLIIGGLALFVKNELNLVMARVQSNYNSFVDEWEDLSKKLGYSFGNYAKVGEDLGFKDQVAIDKETGKPKLIWKLLNPHKDWEYELDRLHEDVNNKMDVFRAENTTEARQNWLNAVKARKDFNNKYMHQENNREYVLTRAMLEKDDLGLEASALQQGLIEKINSIKRHHRDVIIGDVDYDLKALQQELRLLKSIYDKDGKLKTGKDYEIAVRLKEHSERMAKFYDTKYDYDKFEKKLAAYENLLESMYPLDEDMQLRKRQEWIDDNTIIKIKPEYYEYTNGIREEIKTLLAKVDNSSVENKISENINEINDLKKPYKDENGQVDVSLMPVSIITKIYTLEDEIDSLQGQKLTKSGLSKEQVADYVSLKERMKSDPDSITAIDKSTMAYYYSIMKDKGLSKLENALLQGYYNLLENSSSKRFTEQYLDKFESLLKPEMRITILNKYGTGEISNAVVSDLLNNSDIMSDLITSSPEFAQWFESNHKVRKNKEGQTIYKARSVWTLSIPVEERYFETTSITNSSGQTEVIKGVLNNDYSMMFVKDEYKTEKIVGVTVDNRGQFLPLSDEHGPADRRFINDEYFKLKEQGGDKWKALELFTRKSLEYQEGLDDKDKLYLDFPRFERTNIEKAKKVVTQANISEYARNLKQYFKGRKDAPDSGYNYDDELNFVRTDLFDDTTNKIPVAGLYDLEVDDVTTELPTSLMRYMLSAEKNKRLTEINPIVRAIQNTADKNAVQDLKNANKWYMKHKNLVVYKDVKGKSVRSKAIDNFIEREFDGVNVTGKFSDKEFIYNIQKTLFKRASFQFFAFNIPSALKNSFGAKFQAMLESVGGGNFNMKNYAKGEALSTAAMMDLSFGGNIYAKGQKSFTQQFIDAFDPGNGRVEENFGKSLTRDSVTDASEFKFTKTFRNWSELHSTYSVFFAMIDAHEDVDIVINGKTEKVAYKDAWEIRDGKLQLKEGVDPELGITYDENGELKMGKKFTNLKNKIHGVTNNLNGAYARFDQPEMNRYLLAKFAFFLKKYFIPTFIHRFGFGGSWKNPNARLNPYIGDSHIGRYMDTVRTIGQLTRTLGKDASLIEKSQYMNVARTIVELIALYGFTMVMLFVFGYDPDDEDRFEKLRDKSGALPSPFIREDATGGFNLKGWLSNHTLYLLMNIHNENKQYMPLPTYGLDNYTAMLNVNSIAFGPTINAYKDLSKDLWYMATDDKRADYAKEAGPYEWQEEDDNKFLVRLMKMLTLNGKIADPALGIKNLEQSENLK